MDFRNLEETLSPLRVVKNYVLQNMGNGILELVESDEVKNWSLISADQNLVDSSFILNNAEFSLLNGHVIQSENVVRHETPKHNFEDVARSLPVLSTKQFLCSKCPAVFDIEDNYKIHQIIAHTSSINTDVCPICKIKFQRKASLKSHVRIHQIEEIHTCTECHSEFSSQELLLKHLETHDVKIPRTVTESNLVCEYCKLEFNTSQDYSKHMALHAEMKRKVFKGKPTRKRREDSTFYFGCQFCEKRFPKTCLLERHERIHTGEKPFVCFYCKKGFAQKGTLQIHMNSHKGDKQFACSLCSARFNQKGNLRAHITKTHMAAKDQKMYKCDQCPCIFKRIASLNGHVTKVHLKAVNEELSDKMVIDSVMNNLFLLNNAANETNDHIGYREVDDSIHQMTENNIKDPTLENPKSAPPEIAKYDIRTSKSNNDCGLVRLTESTTAGEPRRYMVMQKKIGDVRWYFCNFCSSRFKKPSDLIRHIRKHTGEKPFKCEKCNACFAIKTTLTNHQKTHAREGHKCDYCLCVFRNIRSLNAHVRKHESNASQYVCVLCDKILLSYEASQEHQTLHACESNNIVDIIRPIVKQPSVPTDSGTMKPPKISYTSTSSQTIKPHQCNICDARFSRLNILKRHIQNHSGNRRFKCTICTKSFISRYRLKEHINYHKDLRNYACKICAKAFVTASLLKRHMIVHYTSKPYMCPYCSKKFKTSMLCRIHIKRVHKVDAPNLPQIESTETTNNDSENRKELCNEVANNSEIISQVQEEKPYQHSSVIVSTGNVENNQSYDTVIINIDNVANDSVILQADNLLLNSIQNYAETPLPLLHNTTDIISDRNYIITSTNNQTTHHISSKNPRTVTTISNMDAMSQHASDQFHGDESRANFGSRGGPVNKLIARQSELVNQVLTDPNLMDKLSSNNVLTSSTANSNTDLVIDNMDNNIDFTGSVLDNSFVMCIGCEKVFSDAIDFHAHECNGEKNGKLCESVIQNSLEQTDHKDPNKDNLSNCFLCQRDCLNPAALKKHMSSEHKEYIIKLRTCQFCFKQFQKPSDLDRHIRTHTGEKPFTCSVCSKKFSLKSTLDSHKRTHDITQKVISCDVCNCMFSSKSSLKVHMLLHSGRKPYSCTFCLLKFRTIANRNAHEKKKHLLKQPKSNETRNNCRKKVKATTLLQTVAEQLVNNELQLETSDGQNLSSMPDAVELRVAEQRISNEHNEINETETTNHIISLDPSIILQHLNHADVIIASSNEGHGQGELIPLNLSNITLLDLKNIQELLPQTNIIEMEHRELLNKNIIMNSDNIDNHSQNIVYHTQGENNVLNNTLDINKVTAPMLVNQSSVIRLTTNAADDDNTVSILDLKQIRTDDNEYIKVVSSGITQSNNLKETKSFKKDIKEHLPVSRIQCDICDKLYASMDVLRKHKKNVHFQNKYPCTKCDKIFNSKEELAKQLTFHTGSRPMTCPYCRNTFNGEQHLNTHIKRIHQSNDISEETSAALMNLNELKSSDHLTLKDIVMCICK